MKLKFTIAAHSPLLPKQPVCTADFNSFRLECFQTKTHCACMTCTKKANDLFSIEMLFIALVVRSRSFVRFRFVIVVFGMPNKNIDNDRHFSIVRIVYFWQFCTMTGRNHFWSRRRCIVYRRLDTGDNVFILFICFHSFSFSHFFSSSVLLYGYMCFHVSAAVIVIVKDEWLVTTGYITNGDVIRHTI